jgi:hypothetical protein
VKPDGQEGRNVLAVQRDAIGLSPVAGLMSPSIDLSTPGIHNKSDGAALWPCHRFPISLVLIRPISMKQDARRSSQ